MIWNFFIYVGIDKITIVIVRHGDFTDVGIEFVCSFVTIPVGFVSSDSLFVPFTGKDALTTNVLKTFTNATDTGKQVNKFEIVVTVMLGGRGYQPL